MQNRDSRTKERGNPREKKRERERFIHHKTNVRLQERIHFRDDIQSLPDTQNTSIACMTRKKKHFQISGTTKHVERERKRKKKKMKRRREKQNSIQTKDARREKKKKESTNHKSNRRFRSCDSTRSSSSRTTICQGR